MTNDWQERKGLILGLGTICATVWGYNVYAVANAAGPGVAAVPPPAVAEPVVAPHYADPGRDPFSPPAGVDLSQTPTDTVGYALNLPPTLQEGVWGEPPGLTIDAPLAEDQNPLERPPNLGPPPFTFAGVVGHSALLQEPSGESVPVRAGETIAGFLVARVGLDAVVLVDGPRSYTLGFSSTISNP